MQHGAVRPRVAAGRHEAQWHLASRVCPYLWSVPSCACWAGDGEPQDPELQNCPKTLLFEWAQGQKLPFRARVSHSCQPFPSKEQISWAISTREASQPAPLAKLLNNTDLGINTMLTPGRTRRSLGEISNSQGEVGERKMLSCFLFACFQCRIKPSLSKLHSEQLLGTWALLNAAVREVGQVSRNCSKSQR